MVRDITLHTSTTGWGKSQHHAALSRPTSSRPVSWTRTPIRQGRCREMFHCNCYIDPVFKNMHHPCRNFPRSIWCGNRKRRYLVSTCKIFIDTESSFQRAGAGVSQFATSQNKKFLEAEGGDWLWKRWRNFSSQRKGFLQLGIPFRLSWHARKLFIPRSFQRSLQVKWKHLSWLWWTSLDNLAKSDRS